MLQLSTITKIKDPNSVIDYLLDWTAFLNQIGGDILLESDWTTTDTGLTILQQTFTTTQTTVWIAGGTPPLSSIVNHITTAGGRQQDQTIHLKIRSL